MDWIVFNLADNSCVSTHDTEDEAWEAIVAPQIGTGDVNDLIARHVDDLEDVTDAPA